MADYLTPDDVDRAFADRLSDALIASFCKVNSEWEEAYASEVRSHMRTALAAVGVTGVGFEGDPRAEAWEEGYGRGLWDSHDWRANPYGTRAAS